jgi:hypothetical protein
VLEPQHAQHNVLKIGTELERGISAKFQEHQEINKYLIPRSTASDNFISYRTAGGGYWLTFLYTKFNTNSLSNKRAFFQNQYDSKVFMAILNSSLFWWYYFINYDLFNLKDYMIFSFRFNYPKDPSVSDSLVRLAEDLSKELLANAVEYKIESKTRGTQSTYKYQNRKAKPIIDEIDRVLADHYGFTDEELDFIINYDIKYRLGRAEADEEQIGG